MLDAGGHTARVMQVLFSPDGKELISVSEDKTIRSWDVATGDPLRVLRPPARAGAQGQLFAAALTPDGRTLAVGGISIGAAGDQFFYFVGLPSGRIQWMLWGHKRTAVSVLASPPDGTRLASGSHDHTARIWDVATGRTLRVLGGHTAAIYGVAWSPDGRRLATASYYDKTARIWLAETGEPLAVLRGHGAEVRCIAWRPDGKVLATGSYDRSVLNWSPNGSAYAGYLDLGDQVASLACGADSRRLLVTLGGSVKSRDCLVIDLATGQVSIRFHGHESTVMAVPCRPTAPWRPRPTPLV